jgi:threonine synthase
MNEQEIGIWKYAELLPLIPKRFRLSLGEGETLLKKMDGIYFKCEYLNPTGSHKDRGSAYQISYHYQKGVTQAVISSSGNLAISAAKYCQLAGIHLNVFVSPNINFQKLEALTKSDCKINKSKTPIKDAIQFAKKTGATNLRQSTDPIGSIGYRTIAFELYESDPGIDAVFIPVSSATTLVGIFEGYQKIGKMPSLHAVQTDAVHPVAIEFDRDFREEKKSLADAIVARYTPRKEGAISAIKKTGGTGWIVSDKVMLRAHKWLKDKKIVCSYEGALALGGLWKAQTKGFKFRKPACLLTGKWYPL